MARIIVHSTPPNEAMEAALYHAWTIIANVSEGDWSMQSDEWRAGAVRWRDEFHSILNRFGCSGMD